MVRRTDFNGQTRAVVASATQTLVWTNSDIASERVIAYHISITGTTVDLSMLDRIRLSANGSNIVNITPLQLRAFWQSYSGGRYKLAADAVNFTIPLLLLDSPTPDSQDISQFPIRSQVQLELVFTTGVAETATVFIGWTETSVAPQVFPRILASAMNIGASVSLQRFNFQENGIIRGIGMPHTGIDRAKIALGNEEFTFVPSEEFVGLAAAGDMLFEVESLYGNGPGSAGTPLTTDAISRITAGISAPVDGSFIELQTGAGWAGVANEAVIYAVAPNGPAVPQAA